MNHLTVPFKEQEFIFKMVRRGDETFFILQQDIFFVLSFHQKWIIRVPKGYETDLASIPRILWPLISPFDEYALGSIVHDYLYDSKIVSRWIADCVFIEAMKRSEISFLKIVLFFIAIRMFGRRYWKNA